MESKGDKSEDTEFVCAILRIFHLVPHPVAAKFLDDLVTTTLNVTSGLPGGKVCNPYLAPLIKYFNVYPKEVFSLFCFGLLVFSFLISPQSSEYFFKRLKNPDYAQLFHLTLRSPDAEPLRFYLRNNPELIEASTFKLDPKNAAPEKVPLLDVFCLCY